MGYESPENISKSPTTTTVNRKCRLSRDGGLWSDWTHDARMRPKRGAISAPDRSNHFHLIKLMVYCVMGWGKNIFFPRLLATQTRPVRGKANDVTKNLPFDVIFYLFIFNTFDDRLFCNNNTVQIYNTIWKTLEMNEDNLRYLAIHLLHLFKIN